MNVTVFGDKLKNPERISKVMQMVRGLEGTCYVSEKKTKPNGVWQRCKAINGNGEWFYKFNVGHTPTEIWKKVGESNQVVLKKGFYSGSEQRHMQQPAKTEVVLDKQYKLNEDGREETLQDGIKQFNGVYEFFLTEEYHPIAFNNKLRELISEGMSEDAARHFIKNTPVSMEVYYETGKGMFMVECNSIERGDKIYSPYTKTMYN